MLLFEIYTCAMKVSAEASASLMGGGQGMLPRRRVPQGSPEGRGTIWEIFDTTRENFLFASPPSKKPGDEPGQKYT